MLYLIRLNIYLDYKVLKGRGCVLFLILSSVSNYKVCMHGWMNDMRLLVQGQQTQMAIGRGQVTPVSKVDWAEEKLGDLCCSILSLIFVRDTSTMLVSHWCYNKLPQI